MFDLFGNSGKIRDINDQMREVLRQSSDVALYQTPRMDFFPAKLTAYDSATGYYSWTEQFYDTSGVRIDKPDARTGTASYMPAKLLNGGVITTFPFQVWLMRTIVSDTLGPIYEAMAALPFEEMDLIDKICVTKNSGVVTDINIQRRTYLVAAYLPDPLASTCTTSDSDCCEWVTIACCPDPVKRVLTATFSDGENTCNCLDGISIEITYQGVDGFGSDYWTGALSGCDSSTMTLTLSCHGEGVWAAAITDSTFESGLVNCPFNYHDLVSYDCDPFSIVIALVGGLGGSFGAIPCCGPNPSYVTVTITE